VSFNNDRSGFIAAVRSAIMQLAPQFVVGVEWMFDGTDLKSDTTTVVGAAVIRTSAKVDWITSLAHASLGGKQLAVLRKAGGAWVHDSTTLTATIPGIGTFSASASDNQSGWLLAWALIRLRCQLDRKARVGPYRLDDVNHSASLRPIPSPCRAG